MRSSMFFVAFLVVLAVAFSAGCGGSGQGFRVPNDPLLITSSTLPTMVSGEYVDYDIPVTGGCGGPYVVEVIAGTLPRGVGTLEGTQHKLQGFILEDGIFTFTIKLTDTTCTPFFTTTQSYTWDIQQGPVRIVDCNVPLVLNADFNETPKHFNEPGPDLILGTADDVTVDALQTVVFSTFTAYNLICAGGEAPYTITVLDDPADPLDGLLPLGVAVAPNSTNIIGAPVQVLAGGIPFRLTFQVTDNVGQTSTRKLQWKISTPPLILSNTSLLNGKAGTSFSDGIQIVDGVPPFAFQLCDNAPGNDGDPDTTDNVNDDITYPPGSTPILGSIQGPNNFVNGALPFQLTNTGPAANNARLIAGGTGRVDYPPESGLGSEGPNYSPFPSEGIYLRETGAGAGGLFGIPRRRGTFTVFVHAYSTLVPNELGQHVFKALSHTIDPSEPPVGLGAAFEMDPSFTLDPTGFPALPELAKLPEAEVGQFYNPDSATGHPANGLKLSGFGGVQQDGFIDSPHEANRFTAGAAETAGEYSWTYNPITPLPGLDVGPIAGPLPEGLGSGAFGTALAADVAALARSGARPIELTITDAQLPLSVRMADTTITRQFSIGVGPDKVIITESAQSFTGTTTTGSAQTDLHDRGIKVRGFEVVGGSATYSNLGDGDMVAGHSVPSIAGLAGTDQIGKLIGGTASTNPALETIDILRISVNPGGWWDDVGGMNPKGARSHVATDRNAGNTYYQTNGWYNSGGGWHSSVSYVDLPHSPTIAHDPLTGVYNNGGKLYAFEGGSNFGFFIIRNDSKIYVPFAVAKGALAQKFGDGHLDSGSPGYLSLFRMVSLSVSPDGRFATTKVVKTTSNTVSTMADIDNGCLVVFSLTGEKFSSGETYQFVSLPAGTANTGNYMYSTSIAMTDHSVYFLAGNYTSTYSSWWQHYIHKYDYRTAGDALIPTGGTTGAASSLAAGNGGNWDNTAGSPMQTPFQKYDQPTQLTSVRVGTGFSFTTVTVPSQEMYVYDGWNMGENSLAPVPFRVSADGNHCALLAGVSSGSTSGTDVMLHHSWVASVGGAFDQASTTARHCPNGASRGYGLRRGPQNYRHWGRYSGPTTAFEIADDGSAIAYVCNKYTGSISSTSGTSNWNNEREDVILCKGGGGASTPFSGGNSETDVTALIFGGTIKWRFGSLVFTKDNNGLIFWGGASCRDANATSASGSGYLPVHSTHFLGTYYAYNLNVTNQVRGVMPISAGGIGTFPTYSSSSKFQPTVGTYTQNLGLIKPFGGFISRNRDYFYVMNYHPTSGSDNSVNHLLGINIEDLTNGGTASGHSRGRGFKPTGFPARRGFIPNYYYQPHYALDLAYFVPAHSHGGGMQSMNRETGNVYWMSHYSTQNAQRSTSTSSFSSGPAVAQYWRDQGVSGFHMEAFSADVGGPVARLTHSGLGGDTSNRSGHYFVVSDDGTKVAYVYSTSGTSRGHKTERIGVVTHVGFDASTGAADADMDNSDADKAYLAESSGGRAGESMAFDSAGNKLYYAFRSNATNENDKQMVELGVFKDPVTNTRIRRPFGPDSRRNVLHSGR